MGGQLTATWILQNGKASNLAGPTDNVKGIRVSRGRKVLAVVETERYPRNAQLIKGEGNGKTLGVVAMVKSCAMGCFRAGTGFGKCDQACYSDENGKGGCYANHTRYAAIHTPAGFNVVHNGLLPGTEKFFHLRLPKNNDFSLDRWGTKIYRVDSETSDASLSISLGILQQWARVNPSKTITCISSAYFKVSDTRLAELAELRNVVIGFTLSPWFAADDQANRVKEIKRFQAAGISVCVWVATRPDWDNESQKDLVLSLVRPEQVVEVPYHAAGKHAPYSLHLNPAGACCETRVDSEGRKVDLKTNTVKGEAGERIPHQGRSFGKCVGCRVLCGARYLKATQRVTA